jgi:putative spermidine/putrescine transport system substrate-binding protein
MSISRVLGGIACVAALAAGVGCGDDDDDSSPAGGKADLKGQKLVLVNYGGVTGETQKKAWLDPFSKETGVTTSMDSPTDPAKVKAQVETGNVVWDIVDVDGGVGGAGCGTLFKTREEMGVDISKVDPKYVSDECGVPIMVQVTALMYNKDTYKDNPPTKIADFIDTEKFPGKRLLFNYWLGALDQLELAAGVPPEDVYPYDFDIAKQAYDKVKDDLVLQSELAQQGEALASGDFDMCICYNGRAAITPGVSSDKVGIVWDGVWNAWDLLYATKGSKNPEAQAAFLNYVAKPAAQNAFTAIQPYEPTTIGSPPKVPEHFKYWMVSTNKDKQTNSIDVDYRHLQKPGVADEANEKWLAMTSG